MNRRMSSLLAQQREQVELIEAGQGGARDLLELLPAAVLGIDPEGSLAYVNERAGQLFPQAIGTLGQPPASEVQEVLRQLRDGDASQGLVRVGALQSAERRMNVATDLPLVSRRLADLPPLPAALAEVLQALRHGGPTMERCVELIERDPALAARCLRLANSPFYGRPGRIGSVTGGVTLLGLRTVTGLLTAVTLQQAIRPEQCPGFDLPGFWRHAMNIAMAASTIAPRLDLDASESFLAGLLHDVGELMMVVLAPDAMAEVEQRVADGMPQAQAERELLGIDHVELGAEVARRWNFPAAIVEAIADHHSDDALGNEATALADLLSMVHALVGPLERGLGVEQVLAIVPEPVWQALRHEPPERLGLLTHLATSLAAIGQA
jgi:putative nucleotidyltransferase with HDIG domain